MVNQTIAAPRTQSAHFPNPNRFLRLPAVKDITGLGKTSIYGLIKEGRFPQPTKILGTRASGWREADVLAFINTPEGVTH
jgi:prophage regulatory protein